MKILIAALGLCAACAQALIVRETLSMIAGTELLLGLILASWLLWTGAGGLLGGRLRIGEGARAGSIAVALALVAAGLVPATVILVRLARSAGGWPLGATVPFAWSVACCIAAPAPFAVVYGIFYNTASATAVPGSLRRGIAAAYSLEAGGSAAGALIFPLVVTVLLTQLGSSVAVALGVAAAAAATAPRHRAVAVSAVITAAAVLTALTPRIDRATMSMIARGYVIERIVPSRHAELTVVRDREAVSVYSGPTRIATFPPTGLEEEAVDLPLLAHPHPRSVLLVGGAVGGGIEEAARHPGIERVDWIELDPALASIGAELAGPPAPEDEAGREIHGIEGDGRWYLARRGGSYDVIIVTAPSPTTLRWNRFFTEEFFRTARSSLAPGGILSLSHVSSENYLSPRLVETLAMIERTMRAVFPQVQIVPGVTARFLASDEGIDVGSIPRRLGERRLRTRYLQAEGLSLYCSSARLEEMRRSLTRARSVRLNTDGRPLLVPLELSLDAERTGAPLPFGALARVPAFVPPVAILALLAAAFAAARSRSPARAAVFSFGLGAMLVQLTVMLAFQSYSGLLYDAFIVMTSLFMAGAAAGAASPPRRARPRSVLLAGHAGAAVLAAAVPLWLRTASGGSVAPAAGIAGFLGLPAVAGYLTGIYYRTVVDAAHGRRGDTAPAVYYAWDLFGALVGALIGGLLLIPAAGTLWTALFIVALNGLSAVVLAGRAAA